MGTDQLYISELPAVFCTFIYSASQQAGWADGESAPLAGGWRFSDETAALSLGRSVTNSTGFYSNGGDDSKYV